MSSLCSHGIPAKPLDCCPQHPKQITLDFLQSDEGYLKTVSWQKRCWNRNRSSSSLWFAQNQLNKTLSCKLELWKPDFVLTIIITAHWIAPQPTLFTARLVGLETCSDSLTGLKQILTTWAESEQRILPLRFLTDTSARLLTLTLAKKHPRQKPAKEEVSQRSFLTAPRGCYHWIWLHFLVQNRQHRSDTKLVWGVKAQPGILRVLHSSSVSLGLFLFTLCWKSAEQTLRNKVKGWFYYLIKSIFEGLFEAGL